MVCWKSVGFIQIHVPRVPLQLSFPEHLDPQAFLGDPAKLFRSHWKRSRDTHDRTATLGACGFLGDPAKLFTSLWKRSRDTHDRTATLGKP